MTWAHGWQLNDTEASATRCVECLTQTFESNDWPMFLPHALAEVSPRAKEFSTRDKDQIKYFFISIIRLITFRFSFFSFWRSTNLTMLFKSELIFTHIKVCTYSGDYSHNFILATCLQLSRVSSIRPTRKHSATNDVKHSDVSYYIY